MTQQPSTRYGHAGRLEMLALVPLAVKRVLDIGCHTGGFGGTLKANRSCEVWGIEPDAEAAAIAATLIDRVIVGRYSDHLGIPEGYFDLVVFNDVLEHLVDPWDVLRRVQRHLQPEGCVVVSLPNLLHQSNLLHILKDLDFRYEETGIRDRTHLRFFTAKSAHRMFEESGYEVETLKWINEVWYPRSLTGRLAYRLFRDSLHQTKFIQFAIRARPRRD